MAVLAVRLVLAAAVIAAAAGAELTDLGDLVPDVLRQIPLAVLNAQFEDVSVSPGQELKPAQVRSPPSLAWSAAPGDLFTVCMTDPDAPSRAKATAREFLHWLLVNVPRGEVSSGDARSEGDALAEYVGSGPPKGTGLHRYALLVFRQRGRLDLPDEPRRNSTSREARPRFSIQRFAETHNLELPAAAGTFFQAQWDESVPALHRQLSGLPPLPAP